ncbi:MAG: hypothetical protein IBJ00_07785 [Alphaproteobacteria bacterium]|nr:hypothetical protein [Alphaproteobacteria bacterium]
MLNKVLALALLVLTSGAAVATDVATTTGPDTTAAVAEVPGDEENKPGEEASK